MDGTPANPEPDDALDITVLMGGPSSERDVSRGPDAPAVGHPVDPDGGLAQSIRPGGHFRGRADSVLAGEPVLDGAATVVSLPRLGCRWQGFFESLNSRFRHRLYWGRRVISVASGPWARSRCVLGVGGSVETRNV